MKKAVKLEVGLSLDAFLQLMTFINKEILGGKADDNKKIALLMYELAYVHLVDFRDIINDFDFLNNGLKPKNSLSLSPKKRKSK